MPPYYLDADTLIQAKNGPYGFDFHPTFWTWIDQQHSDGLIFSSIMIWKELAAGDDELAAWAKTRRDSGFFIQPNHEVQEIFQIIADWVNENYSARKAQLFLDCGDPWLIAQAKVDGATVVTHETIVPPNSTMIKIPNVCQQFQVECMKLWQMLRELGARF